MASKKKSSTKIKKTTTRSSSPVKKLNQVRSDISKARRPVYALNAKIKNAPSKYYERKFKKERDQLLKKVDKQISYLKNQRSLLSDQLHRYEDAKKRKKSEYSKVYRIEDKIEKAIENRDIKEAERLRYQLLKHLGEIDRLRMEMGVIDKPSKPIPISPDTKEGGKGFILDSKSPYAIWEGIKQLHSDLDGGFFKFYIINGKRFSSANEIQITAEASQFWVASKKRTDGTPYVNRFYNPTTKTVKYLHNNS